jgi:NAD(P)-dependent dehydrogenase (short-subunit alcohol dehydrogenase family)
MSTRPVALVTGAARRVGREIALDLAAHGWDVAVHYRTSDAEAQDTVARCAARRTRRGLRRRPRRRGAVRRAAARRGAGLRPRCDAVVNNASLFEYDDVASFGHAAMERHWRANTAPAVLLARALHAHVARAAPRRRRRRVVNLLDQKLWNPNPDYLSYTLSKAALEAATTMLAQALAPRVRVCGVAPGVTLPRARWTRPSFEAAHRLTPLQRSSTPQDVARAVRFLLESPAITGTTLLVDGGQHLQGAAARRDVPRRPGLI